MFSLMEPLLPQLWPTFTLFGEYIIYQQDCTALYCSLFRCAILSYLLYRNFVWGIQTIDCKQEKYDT